MNLWKNVILNDWNCIGWESDLYEMTCNPWISGATIFDLKDMNLYFVFALNPTKKITKPNKNGNLSLVNVIFLYFCPGSNKVYHVSRYGVLLWLIGHKVHRLSKEVNIRMHYRVNCELNCCFSYDFCFHCTHEFCSNTPNNFKTSFALKQCQRWLQKRWRLWPSVTPNIYETMSSWLRKELRFVCRNNKLSYLDTFLTFNFDLFWSKLDWQQNNKVARQSFHLTSFLFEESFDWIKTEIVEGKGNLIETTTMSNVYKKVFPFLLKSYTFNIFWGFFWLKKLGQILRKLNWQRNEIFNLEETRKLWFINSQAEWNHCN